MLNYYSAYFPCETFGLGKYNSQILFVLWDFIFELRLWID